MAHERLGYPGRGGPPFERTSSPNQLSFVVVAPLSSGPSKRIDLCRASIGAAPSQLVAVKRLREDAAAGPIDPSLERRFFDEVWITAAVDHPNVVKVVGWGVDTEGAYLAVELVEGVSLARLAKNVFETGEQFPQRMVASLALGIARGLEAAHSLCSQSGDPLFIVHRDLTASNVLISFAGDVKVADFGLAKARDRLSHTTGELPDRSILHIAPEELLGRPVDHRADIYALGVVLFELLAERPLYVSDNMVDVMEFIKRAARPDLGAVRGRLDRPMIELVSRMLSLDVTERPQSAKEVADTLENWLRAHGYAADAQESLARFVRRNCMRQKRWFEEVMGQGRPERPVLSRSMSEAPSPRSTKPSKPSKLRSDLEATVVDRHGAKQGVREVEESSFDEGPTETRSELGVDPRPGERTFEMSPRAGREPIEPRTLPNRRPLEAHVDAEILRIEGRISPLLNQTQEVTRRLSLLQEEHQRLTSALAGERRELATWTFAKGLLEAGDVEAVAALIKERRKPVV